MTQEEETELRERLAGEIPDGLFQISETMWIGKQGYIEYMVALRKLAYNIQAAKPFTRE